MSEPNTRDIEVAKAFLDATHPHPFNMTKWAAEQFAAYREEIEARAATPEEREDEELVRAAIKKAQDVLLLAADNHPSLTGDDYMSAIEGLDSALRSRQPSTDADEAIRKAYTEGYQDGLGKFVPEYPEIPLPSLDASRPSPQGEDAPYSLMLSTLKHALIDMDFIDRLTDAAGVHRFRLLRDELTNAIDQAERARLSATADARETSHD